MHDSEALNRPAIIPDSELSDDIEYTRNLISRQKQVLTQVILFNLSVKTLTSLSMIRFMIPINLAY